MSHILEKCGDIDDAIRQLTSLKLSYQNARSAEDSEGSRDARESGRSDDHAAASGRVPDADAAAAAAADSSAPSAVEAAEAEARAAAADSAAAASLASAASAVVSREWVGALVQEMSAATDVPDAHERATRVLQAFEASVRSAVAGESAAAGGGGDASARAEILARENLILKRAVAIQNARQQEYGQTQQQVVALQRLCAQYQEQLQAAERQNYSLGLHLKEAMGTPSPGVFDRNPDVF